MSQQAPPMNWIVESVIQFTRSPLWRGPVNNFIDEKCALFENESPEYSVEYTVIHKEFMELVDRLLTSFVDELGISQEEAFKAVEEELKANNNVDKRPLYSFLNYVMYADSIASFRAMMAKRNLALDLEAYSAIARQATAAAAAEQKLPPGSLVAEEICQGTGPQKHTRASQSVSYSKAMHNKALQQSILEQQIIQKQMELEDAELQEALMLSVAAEEERVRAQKEEAGRRAAEAERTHNEQAAVTERARIAQLEEEKQRAIQEMEAKTLEARQQAILVRLTATAESLPIPVEPLSQSEGAAPVALADPPSSSAATTEATPPLAVPAPAPSPLPVPLPVPAAPVAAPEAVTSATPPAQPPSGAPGSPMKTIPPPQPRVLAPLKARPVYDAQVPLMGNQPSFQQLQAMTKAAAAAAKAPTAAPGSQPELPVADGAVSKEEMEARAKYMREQREKIVAQKMATRQQELDTYVAAGGSKGGLPKNEDGSEEKKLTADIGRRLRDDILSEVRKQS